MCWNLKLAGRHVGWTLEHGPGLASTYPCDEVGHGHAPEVDEPLAVVLGPVRRVKVGAVRVGGRVDRARLPLDGPVGWRWPG